MSSPGPITCCCNKDLFVCCLFIKAEVACTVLENLDNCQVGGGPPATIDVFTRQVKCVESEEQCNCDDLNVQECGWFGCVPELVALGYTVNAAIVDCAATFLEGELCVDGAAPPDTICTPRPGPCPKYKCGPCGPIADGCTMDCPQTIPTCTPQACCQPPPPPSLCCFYTIAGDCISSVNCAPCPENPTAGVHTRPVDTCDDCNTNPGTPCILLTTTCCGSSKASGSGSGNPCCPDSDPNCCVDFCGDCDAICCKNCVSVGADGFATCSLQRCYCPCGDNMPAQLPLCPCTEGPTLTCNAFTLINPLNNFAEGRLTSGFTSVDSAYSLNTLFLFGYGNKHL